MLALVGCPLAPPPSNDRFVFAEPIAFDAAGAAVVTGTIIDDLDPHFFDLGSLDAGDRIIVDVDTPDSDLDAAVAIFDEYHDLFRANDDEDSDAGFVDPYIDEIVRHASNKYVVAIARSSLKPAVFGSYRMQITVQRGGIAPVRQAQTILLDFDGGSVTTADGTVLSVGAFDAANIDSAYDGLTDEIKASIITTFAARFERFDLIILNTDDDTPPEDGNFSTVSFGGANESFGNIAYETFGLTMSGTDPYNRDPTDDAIVFTDSFKPSLFAGPPSVDQLGLVIANVAAHEVGHLLGLDHVKFNRSLMRFVNLSVFLEELDFERNIVADEVFLDLPVDAAWQDAEQLLREVLGEFPAPIALVAADLDGDGDTDLATANSESDNVTVLLNDGLAQFTAARSYETGPSTSDFVAGDLDGDGDVDLAVANTRLRTGSIATGLSVLRNRGDATFAAAMPVDVPKAPETVAVGDFDSDGDLELIAVPRFLSEEIFVLSNQGGATFAEADAVMPGFADAVVVLADLDADGDLDLAAADPDAGSVTVFRSAGDGTFTSIGTVGTGGTPHGLVSGDLDGDGDEDLVVATLGTAGIEVLWNGGTAVFANGGSVATSDIPISLHAVDLDGDGDLDLARIERRGGSSASTVVLHLNDGTGATFNTTELPAGDSPTAIEVADLDGDGDPDLAVTDDDAHTVSIRLNQGNGSFSEAIDVSIGPT